MIRTLLGRFSSVLTANPRKLCIGTILLVLVVGLNSWLLFFYKLPGTNLFWSALQNAGHALLFLGLSLSVSFIFHYYVFNQRKRFVVGFTIASCLIFGGGVELIQSQVGREASWSDFWLDLAGTLSGVSLYFVALLAGWKKLPFLIASGVLMSLSLAEATKWRLGEYYREKAFPVIADFDNDWLNIYAYAAYNGVLEFVPAPVGWHNNTSVAARLMMKPAPWPGMTLREVRRDWSGYESFSFDVYNPQPSDVMLVMRIHDEAHKNKHNDRFNRTIMLAPGAHHIEIPLVKVKLAPKDREMNMQRIETVMFYSYQLETELILYFDNVRLYR
ncbi:VanZ family protein [Teredinibacter purpureus]|uniref:VanZ family protein n=1 Tax=Teredinibacter purpureus TaxID=2731756 RepID=UPI0005F81F81|nr:VanZ family protein [Teredinibacter purpureus]